MRRGSHLPRSSATSIGASPIGQSGFNGASREDGSSRGIAMKIGNTMTIALTGLLAIASAPWGPVEHHAVAHAASASYIVQAPSFSAASAAVKNAGGHITHELGIISAVAADLTAPQVTVLRADRRLAVTPNSSMAVAGTNAPVQPYVV